MIPLLGVLLTVVGLTINTAMPEMVILPDISGSLLIATVAARRRHWPWVFPLLLLHDLILYWALVPYTLVFTASALLLVARVDLRLEVALPQRMMMVGIAHIPMWLEGWSPQAIVLSLLLTVALWYWIREEATLLQTEGLPTITP